MTLDQEALNTMERAADELWQLKTKAEDAVKVTAEAKLAETLKDKWLRMHRKIEAAKTLLAVEPDETEA